MPYLATAKDTNTPRTPRKCEFCEHVVTSVNGETGLRSAYQRHVKEHHKPQYQADGKNHDKRFRQYPTTSTPPEPKPEKSARFELPCPYCDVVLSSVRESLLPRMLASHKRAKHEPQLMDEIADKRQCSLDAVQAEPLVEVDVIQAYYVKSRLRSKYPAPAKVMVPVRWSVTRVNVKVCGDGRRVAYRHGLVGEGWTV